MLGAVKICCGRLCYVRPC